MSVQVHINNLKYLKSVNLVDYSKITHEIITVRIT